MVLFCRLFAITLFATSVYARSERISAMGDYQVPVSMVELTPFATYETEYTFKRAGIMTTSIEYNLPLELTGIEQEVEIFPDPLDPTKWSGTHADGTCQLTAESAVCQLKYKNLQFNANIVEQAILSKYPNIQEQEARMQVFRLFNGEPIGILRVALPSAHRYRSQR